MNNKLTDLNDYLFEELERLNDDETLSSDEVFEKELKRSKAITGVAQNIINNASLLLDAQKYVDEYGNRTDMPKLLIGEGNKK